MPAPTPRACTRALSPLGGVLVDDLGPGLHNSHLPSKPHTLHILRGAAECRLDSTTHVSKAL